MGLEGRKVPLLGQKFGDMHLIFSSSLMYKKDFRKVSLQLSWASESMLRISTLFPKGLSVCGSSEEQK